MPRPLPIDLPAGRPTSGPVSDAPAARKADYDVPPSHGRAARDGAVDHLEAFGAEADLLSEEGSAAVTDAGRSKVWRRFSVALLFFCLLGGVAVGAYYIGVIRPTGPMQQWPAGPPLTGIATFRSQPAGARVLVDRILRGLTPLQLALPAGRHSIEIHSAEASRDLIVNVEPGAQIAHAVEFGTSESVSTGRLEVESEPPGAEISVDGVIRGIAPATISIHAGDHLVAVASGEQMASRQVTVTAGATTAVVLTLAEPASGSGWVCIKAPFGLRVFENGQLIGTSQVDRIMLVAGDHQIELTNAEFAFTTKLTVRIEDGKTAALVVPVPSGLLSINVRPWAEIWIDGKPFGTTPIGNITLPIGPHEIVWRHPEHGERRREITISASEPVRLGLEF